MLKTFNSRLIKIPYVIACFVFFFVYMIPAYAKEDIDYSSYDYSIYIEEIPEYNDADYARFLDEEPEYTQTQAYSNYSTFIEDNADLLSDQEEAALLQVMQPISEYGGALFVTGYGNGESTAKEYYRQYFDRSSGIVFYIDMGCRKLCIFSDGDIYKTISKSRANEITNSVNHYASDEEYYICARTAFERIYSLLQGEYIFRPMRYLHNFFLAVMLASILMYSYIYMSRSNIKNEMIIQQKRNEYIDGAAVIKFSNMDKQYERSVTHSSDSGGGGGGGGGDSGGGGSSGF